MPFLTGLRITLSAPMRFLAPILLGAASVCFAQPEQPLVLEVPLKCRFGENCFIQQYFDHDTGPAAKDFRCGPMTYDGHDGTDLRLPTLAEQQKGVDVLAAAAGTVRGTRDGMDDVNIRLAGAESVKGRECGNGVVLVHPGGWETQYCHMAKGSVRVRNGQSVAAGEVLGRVGMSGDAEFPHLHFAVRRGTEKGDPFAWGATPAACSSGKSLWSEKAAAALAYHSPTVLNTGFAPMPVSMDDVESGRAAGAKLAQDSPNLLAFVRAIGLRQGDVQILTVRGPGGVAFARTEVPPLESNKAQWLQFVGKRRTADSWPRGVYEAQYEVKRDGATALLRRFEMELR
jgi:murein DD-endopeptidase MepM/ murein hydrolase activator NlpD